MHGQNHITVYVVWKYRATVYGKLKEYEREML